MDFPKDANAFMFFVFISIVLISRLIVNYIIGLYPQMEIDENVWLIQIIGSLSYFILPLFLLIIFKRISFKYILPFKKISLKNFFLVIIISLTMQPTIQLIAEITNVFHEDEISEAIDIFMKLPYWKSLISIAIVPAITEELIFRGVILTGYKKTKLLTGILVSSFYFGIMHLTISQLFYTIIGGVIFGFLVKITGSIFSSILSHFILNGTQITISYIFYNIYNDHESTKFIKDSIFDMEHTNFIAVIYALINFLITLPLFVLSIYLFIRVNKETIDDFRVKDSKVRNYKKNFKLKDTDLEHIEIPKVFTMFFYLNITFYIFYMIFKRMY